MPNIIPPIVSSSPPPLDPLDDDNEEDDNDDDFGDFTGADFGSHIDSTLPKSIPDTSWPLPSLKEPLSKPDIFQNGVISLELSTEDALPQSQTVLDDEEFLENADNASHDSVVSAVSDSGNCSASQNSNGTSPMPIAEVEDEAVVKSDSCHLQQNGSTAQTSNSSTASGEMIFSVPATNQNISDFNEASDLGESRTLNNIINETLVEDSLQVSPNVLIPSPEENRSDSPPCKKPGVDQEENSESKVVIANSSAEKLESDTTSFPSIEATSHGDDDPDEFGGWNSTVPEPNSFEPVNNQSNACFEAKSDLSTLETTGSKGFDGFEENECVRGMIIPDIPGLGDFDGDDDNDDFGEFRGTEPSPQCSSGTQSIDEPNNEAEYQSPSRRPTLVLSENVNDMTDEQPVSIVEEETVPSQQLTAASPDKSVKNSLEEGSSAVCDAVEEEKSVVPLESNQSSSQDPSFAGDFDGEFADFSQAGGEENPASDVWAQAAQASTIQNTLPSQDPLEFDDFEDFESAEFQSAHPKTDLEPPPSSYFDLNKIQSTLSELLKENFPVPGESNMLTEMENMGTNGLSALILDVEESPTWQGLRDLEATPSLSFQWPGSHSNRGLLGALNIDSRNILFGPKWNTVVPRFAANLGFSPLEPVRAVQNQPPSEPPPRPEAIQPRVVENIKPSSSEPGVVPAAQFDWNDSGLTNPLDSSTYSTLLDLDLLASFDNLASCSSQSMSTSHAAVKCRSLLTNKDQMNGALATTAASGNPAMTTTPLQVEQLLASSKRSAPLTSLEKKSRDPTLSPEAVRVLDTLPELAFLSARMLMFPVQGDRNENKL